MRWVKIQNTASPPPNWSKKADLFNQELLSATTEDERKQIIKDHEGLWQETAFKTWFIDLFHKKCWYTEAKEKVSAYHVDHFRPKGQITDSEGTAEGYWWLAFKWVNYRVAGQLINVKKKDKFPIKGTFRANILDQNLSKEENLLIDPLDEEDVALISFDESGEIVYAGGINEHDKERVDATKDILGLNKIQTLVEARQQKWDKCMEYITDYEKANELSDPLKKCRKACAKVELKKLIREDEEFSAVALACIRKKAPETLINQVFS